MLIRAGKRLGILITYSFTYNKSYSGVYVEMDYG